MPTRRLYGRNSPISNLKSDGALVKSNDSVSIR
jgi:hypothetical protein